MNGAKAEAIRRQRHEMEHIADLPSRLAPDERTLPRMLHRQAALFGNRRLVEIDGRAWSFAETLEMAARFGGAVRPALSAAITSRPCAATGGSCCRSISAAAGSAR
jgi:hypothetical protein